MPIDPNFQKKRNQQFIIKIDSNHWEVEILYPVSSQAFLIVGLFLRKISTHSLSTRLKGQEKFTHLPHLLINKKLKKMKISIIDIIRIRNCLPRIKKINGYPTRIINPIIKLHIVWALFPSYS